MEPVAITIMVLGFMFLITGLGTSIYITIKNSK